MSKGRGRLMRLGLAALSGALLFLSFAGFDVWAFGFLFVVPLLALVDGAESAKQAWWWSLLTGWIANTGGFYWISGLLMDFGHLPMPAAVGICLLLCLFQGLSFGVFGVLVYALRRHLKAPMGVLAPVVWVAVELVMPLIFPYYLGNSQYNFAPMIQSAELWGPLGVSAVLFVCNGALYDALSAFVLRRGAVEGRERRLAVLSLAAGLGVVGLNIGYGVVRIGQVEAEEAAAEKLRIGMVEANIGIWEKEAPDRIANNHTLHQQLSKRLVDEEQVELIVWPESSFQVPLVFASREASEDVGELRRSVQAYRRFFPQDATYLMRSDEPVVGSVEEDEAAKRRPQDRFAPQRAHNVPLLIGGVTFRELSPEELASDPPHKKMSEVGPDGTVRQVPRNYRIYNSAVLLDELGRVKGLYNKTRLLAFGETIPGADLWPWVYDLIPEASEFTPGEEVKTFELKGHRLGMMICYEDILPSFGRELAKQEPEVLINMTNDAWFGKTHEPWLHLALASFRAVETRRWLLRSTNTGVTAFIDAKGQVVSHTSLEDAEILAHDVPMLKGGLTPYVMLGDVIGYLAWLGVLGMGGVAWRRSRGR